MATQRNENSKMPYPTLTIVLTAHCSLGVQQETGEHKDHDCEELDHSDSNHRIDHEIFFQCWVSCNTRHQSVEEDTKSQGRQADTIDGDSGREHTNSCIALLGAGHRTQWSHNCCWLHGSRWHDPEHTSCAECLHLVKLERRSRN